MGIAPKPSGFATSKVGKEKILQRTKGLLDDSSVLLALPFEGVTKEQVDILRDMIPDETTASVVKNSLMGISTKGTEFEGVTGFLKDENMFVFVPEGKSKATFEGIKKWQKEVKRTESEHALKCAILEGVVYTDGNVETACNLPTKEELLTKIAIGLKYPSLKIARAVKAVPTKVGRAFGALKKKLEEEEQ